MTPIQFHDYTIWPDGRVWSNKSKGQWIKSHLKNNGYRFIRLRINNAYHYFQLHRLVLQCFAPVPGWETLDVNHKNGMKQDCRLENLEWNTKSENMQHALHVIKTFPVGEKSFRSKLKTQEVLAIRDLYARKIYNRAELAQKFGCTTSNISLIVTRRNWKHI